MTASTPSTPSPRPPATHTSLAAHPGGPAPPGLSPRWPIGPPPIPRQHGAWMMLYLPLLVTLVGSGARDVLPSVLLILAATGAFLGQNAAGLLIRHRLRGGALFWLCIYFLLCATSAAALAGVWGATGLLWLALPGAGLFLYQAAVVWPSNKQVDRSFWGEGAAAGCLALTAPAAYEVGKGAIDPVALYIWAAFTAYFIGGVFYVKMRVSAATIRSELTPAIRWRIGRGLFLYHLLLIVAVAVSSIAVGGAAGILVVLAYLPAFSRAFCGWVTVSNQLGSLKRIGVGEVFLSTWFGGCLAAAMLTAGLPGVPA